MIRDPEIREAAERLAAEWARSINTLATAAEVHAIEFALDRLADPASPHDEAFNHICRSRWTTPVREVGRARELSEY